MNLLYWRNRSSSAIIRPLQNTTHMILKYNGNKIQNECKLTLAKTELIKFQCATEHKDTSRLYREHSRL